MTSAASRPRLTSRRGSGASSRCVRVNPGSAQKKGEPEAPGRVTMRSECCARRHHQLGYYFSRPYCWRQLRVPSGKHSFRQTTFPSPFQPNIAATERETRSSFISGSSTLATSPSMYPENGTRNALPVRMCGHGSKAATVNITFPVTRVHAAASRRMSFSEWARKQSCLNPIRILTVRFKWTPDFTVVSRLGIIGSKQV